MVVASAGTLLGATILVAQSERRTIRPDEPRWESCSEMHATFVGRFESVGGMGLSRMPKPPMLDRSGVLEIEWDRYALDSIELLGLLKQETPVAYVPQWHGAATPSGFKSRALTPFEQEALAGFRAGKDIASAGDDKGGLLCAGALRAKDSCINCHRAKKIGDLLGSFSYRLRALK